MEALTLRLEVAAAPSLVELVGNLIGALRATPSVQPVNAEAPTAPAPMQSPAAPKPRRAKAATAVDSQPAVEEAKTPAAPAAEEAETQEQTEAPAPIKAEAPATPEEAATIPAPAEVKAPVIKSQEQAVAEANTAVKEEKNDLPFGSEPSTNVDIIVLRSKANNLCLADPANKDKVQALIQQFGVQSLPQLPHDKFTAFYAELAKIG